MSKSKDYVYDNLDVFDYVPEYLKNQLNSSMSRNLFNKFLTKEEAIQVFGLIGNKSVNDTDSRPLLPQSTTERKINSLIPMIYGKSGTEETVLSFSDIINKARLLGINVDDFSNWGGCQSFNFVPPINIDKFINFSSYYWYGKQTSFSPEWNTALDPEFYVIAHPNKGDVDKFPVEVATYTPVVLTGSGHVDENWIVRFTDSQHFIITGETSGISGPGVVDTVFRSTYITFKISSGSIPFVNGDTFVISVKDLTEQYSFTYSGTGNGGISGIKGIRSFASIPQPDGTHVQTYDGMRVLVTAQHNPAENGIYIVRSGDWERASDCLEGSTGFDGIKVFVSGGADQMVGLWEASSFSSESKVFTKIGEYRNVSEWTEFNFWVHRDDAESLGININNAIQAKRPIIEYSFDLEMNTDQNNGAPVGGNVSFNAEQKKHKFNQLPLFNLYLANGEFAEKVSSIFYYEESSKSAIDAQLKRRIALDENNDFIFSQGCVDENGGMLFFKDSGIIKSVWIAGPEQAGISTPLFSSVQRQIKDVEVGVTVTNVYAHIKNANWLATAYSTTGFTLVSSQYSEVKVDIPFDVTTDVFDSLGNRLFTITIPSGSSEVPASGVSVGDYFRFKSMNKEFPRYVTGETLSTSHEIPVDAEMVDGVWTTPFQLEFNPYHENRKTIHFGDLINHFKSIIGAQPGFSGSSFGRNNFRNITNKNEGLGGKIKEHNGAFNKFVGLINQENISPLSIIDFAETQYAQALNSVSEYVNKYAIDFLTAHGTPSFLMGAETTNKIPTLVDEYCAYYKERVDVASYLSESTSVMPNWPATLPSLGLSGAVRPFFGFDHELGLNVIVHHDGHLSPKNQRNVEFDRGLTKQVVIRSDGTSCPGIFSSSVPAKPYKNQLWFHSNTAVLRIFDVSSDTTAPVSPVANDFWYDRGNDTLYQWIGGEWVVKTDKSVAWKIVETDSILNAFIIEIENRLFNSIHPNQQMVWDASQYVSVDTLKFELAKFAAKYNYDPYAPDFNSDDAFTWNYKQADFPVIGTGHARWYDIYSSYFAAATGTPFTTCRPNLEPWRLLGYEAMPAGFYETYGGVSHVDAALAVNDVSVVLFDNLVSISACPNVVDGKTLTVGERVLVSSGPNVGIYTVTSVGTGANGTWAFASDFNPFAMQVGLNVSVKNGSLWAGSTWVVVDNGGVKSFEQVRQWKLQLWADIQAAFPTLKLCVNVFNEQLLPPYVDPLSPAAQFGLLNTVPTGIMNSYEFGDNGPTELVWKKSLEHSYSLLRSSMKNQPLLFIESTWGDVHRSVGGLKLDKQLARKESHKEILLHGETLPVKNRARIIYSSVLPVTGAGTGKKSVELVCDYVTEFFDFFKVTVDGKIVGHLNNFDPSSGIDFSQLEITDQGMGFYVGDKISFSLTDGVISNVVFESAKTKVYQGIGQFYTQLLKFNSYSLVTSKNAVMFRKWDVNLGYRFGAFMNTETLSLKSNGFDIPLGMCNMLTKISPYAGSSWINALRIQLVKVGSTQLVDGIYKPANNGDDWVFRIETYFNKYPEISYYDVDTAGEFMTFDVLSGRRCPITWKNYSSNRGVKTSTVPMIITGVQNVVNFLFGYTRFLQDSGWVINNNANPDIDAETGRIITWQLEIEKFVDAVYDNLTPGSGVIINPFMKNVWFQTAKGLVSKFETINFLDVSASQFAFDITGSQISLDQLKIIREEDTTMVISDTPIFGLHVNVEHYEHCVLFPYYLDNSKKQKLIFDPFLGMKLGKILVQGSRQAVQTARPSFGGFYLSNNKMKRNLVSSIDDLGKLYDSDAVFNNPEYSKYALALFGFSEKDYFDSLGTSKKNQFNFWRGMIQAKGTNSSVEAFLNNKAFEDAKIDEYWAFKVAEYGDARTKSFPELKLQASDSLIDTTRFQFDGDQVLPGFTQISSTDESRWVNLDDLNELKARGMYFDATSVGKIVLKEKPQIVNLINEGNGAVKFVTGSTVVKSFMSPTVIRCTMDDVETFTVVNTATNQELGTGIIGINFTCSDFEFTVETDLFEMQPGDSFTFAISVDIDTLVKLPFVSDKLVISDTSSVEVVSQTVVRVKKANTAPITIEGFGPQKPKFSPIKFFDYKSDLFLGNIPYWNPAIGQHTPEAYEIINMISPVDPAKYNQTTQIVNNPNYDMLKPWGSREVGKVWWNTNKLDYKPYYDPAFYPNIEHRLSKWGSAAEYSSVEVYEWVESEVPPEKYAEQVLADAKDQNKTQSDKKSGEVAISKLLTRSRTWNVRPVAWKKNEDYESPFMTSALFNKIRVTSETIGASRAILNYGRFSDYSINAGMSLSAWNKIDDVPVGQALVGTEKTYVIGAENEFMRPYIDQPSDSRISSVNVDFSTKTSSIGKAIGKIAFTNYSEGGIYYVRATEINTGKSQSLPVSDVVVGTPFVDFDFFELGVKIRLNLA